MMLGRSLFGIALSAALAGCTGVGPDFVAPRALLPSISFLEAGRSGPGQVVGKTTTAPIDAQWWQAFHDPVLSALESRVADQNLDVRTATLRLAQSRAQRSVTAAAELPTLNGTAQYQRELLSQNGLVSLIPAGALGGGGAAGGGAAGGAATSGFNQPISIYNVGFDASWEIDVWGHVRRQIEAADANLDASAEQRRDVLVSSLAEVARNYVQLRGTQTLMRIARDNIAVDKEILGVAKVRQEKGLTTGLDTESAAAQVASVEAQLPQLEQQEIQQINAIGLLLDEPPLALAKKLTAVRPVPANPPRIPVGLPTELARRRPDIRMAEAQLHMATANIGVAVAEFYPSLRFNGTPTLQALDAKNLFKGSSLNYVLGPSITIPIFEGGRLKSSLVLREHQQQEAAVSYHKTVLQAWHDVVNAMTAYRTEQQRQAKLKEQVAHARAALVLARSRYSDGVADFTTLLSNAQTVLSAEQQFAQSTANVSINLVALYKALGGGWELTYPDPRATPLLILDTPAPVLEVSLPR